MRKIKKGSTDRSVVIRIIDSTDGSPETGVVYNTSGIDLWYRREGSTKTSITEATLSALDSAHSDGGIIHIGDGYYRLDLPDAAWATGANHVMIGGAVTGMIVIGQEVQLVNFDPEDGVRLGLTALPNASADAAGGLAISDAGGLDLDTLLARLDAAITTRAAAADVATIAEIVAAIEAGDVGTILTIAQKLDTALELDGAVYRFTTNALENAPAGGVGSSDWTAGEREQIRSAIGIDGTKTAATGGQLQALDTVADAIKAKTDNLPTDPADASDLAALLSAISSAIGTRAAPGDAMALTSGERAALGSALGARTVGPTTADRLLLGIAAGLLAKTSGGGTGTIPVRNLADTADLATITVDENDNRTAVTIIWENA